MILLVQKEGIEDRVVKGVRLKNGMARLPDHLKRKADSICNAFNIKQCQVNSQEELDEIIGEIELDYEDFGASIKAETAVAGKNIQVPLPDDTDDESEKDKSEKDEDSTS